MSSGDPSTRDRERLEYVVSASTSNWGSIRRQAQQLLKQGGLAALQAAAELVAEAEFRDRVPSDERFLDDLWQSLTHARSTLSWLPPRRASIERGLPVWSLAADGRGQLSYPKLGVPTPLPESSHSIRLQSDSVAHPEALGAFRSILTRSNGRAQACRLMADHPLTPCREIVRALAIEFEPLTPAVPTTSEPAAASITPADAARQILCVAINGGAYDHASGAAHGRLGAWMTLAFLAGCPSDATFDDVVQAVEASHWITIATSTPWFEDVAWDGCIACIGPSQTCITAVAWTDTD